MSLPTFTDLLRTAVAAMQAAHPERLGEIARAHAAIVEGHVVPVDADNGQVLSRNGSTWYATNGSCNCTAGSFGKPCRHLAAWKLYRYIQKQHAALLPQAPAVEAEPLEAPTPPVGPLPEAPASVNCYLTIDGRQVQLTLRDTDEGRLLARLQTVLAQYPAPQPPAQAASPEAGWCVIHNVQMKEHSNAKGTWYSHYFEGAHCKGRRGRS